ncbi:caspase family protein [Streptomyces sp. MNU76]|uniref:caspase family protein n=1 Tax=Streptomyces sp. MNU76 TaxID=2560026 RepID=UPI001E3FFF6F|nr:caspase family protein [Streptomyces sp. MNU76]MCC9711627.1 caspase family protein [Streptomyces sp. MNU76]
MESDDAAVLIGVSSYRDPSLLDVPAARNSLHAMHRLLISPELCGWSEDQVHVLEDPAGATDMALELHRLAEETTGTLLIYFVGHGVVSKSGALCLAAGDSQLRYPDLTGLEYDKVRSALLDSPAQVKLVILDCCYSGRIIHGLAGTGESQLVDSTDIRGVYTLTAADQVAHAPSRDETASTSFTQVLCDVVRSGIPGAPPALALTDIYPKLKSTLKARGLPEPNQRGTDTVESYPFSRNVAYTGGTGFRLLPQEHVDRFLRFLAAQPHHDLTAESIEKLEDWPGVYLLHRESHDAPEILYVARNDRSIAARLGQHLRKISGRCHIDARDLSFSYLKLDDDLSVLAPERLVLRHLHAQGRSPQWNNTGFGNNDAGRMRDSRRRNGDDFDVLHPIDLSWPVRFDDPARKVTAHKMAAQLRAQLPYSFRIEPWETELDHVRLALPDGSLSADQAFRLLATAMGDSWQISALVGQVLIYREQDKRYPNAIRYYAGTQTITEMPDVCKAAGLPDDC